MNLWARMTVRCRRPPSTPVQRHLGTVRTLSQVRGGPAGWSDRGGAPAGDSTTVEVVPTGSTVSEPTLPNLANLEEIFSEEGDGAVGPVRSPGRQSRVSPQGPHLCIWGPYDRRHECGYRPRLTTDRRERGRAHHGDATQRLPPPVVCGQYGRPSGRRPRRPDPPPAVGRRQTAGPGPWLTPGSFPRSEPSARCDAGGGGRRPSLAVAAPPWRPGRFLPCRWTTTPRPGRPGRPVPGAPENAPAGAPRCRARSRLESAAGNQP